MTKNLDVTHYRNGDSIPNVQDTEKWRKLTTGAWCYYENKPENGAVYGKLYNWYAVNDPRGLAPKGYHIPSYKEWDVFTGLLRGMTEAGGKLKETGTKHWKEPNTDATDEIGFTALPGGVRYADGSFSRLGEDGYWWSTKENDDTTACMSNINFQTKFFLLNLRWGEKTIPGKEKEESYTAEKKVGGSIRCLKD
jgi:uncharacterized protein (TIGR02145 family)